MKKAVCLMAPDNKGRFVAVSRPNAPTMWGFPGGKVDPGETTYEALLRELQEEIGLVGFEPEEIVPIYSGICPGKGPDDTYWVTTYYLHRIVDSSKLTPEAGLTIGSICEAKMCDRQFTPFAQFNKKVFEAYEAYTSI